MFIIVPHSTLHSAEMLFINYESSHTLINSVSNMCDLPMPNIALLLLFLYSIIPFTGTLKKIFFLPVTDEIVLVFKM